MSTTRRWNGDAKTRSNSIRNLPAGPRSTANKVLIGVVGEDRIDCTAPAGAEVFEQLLGRGAAGAGDREQRVEIMSFVFAERAAPRAAMQAFAGDVEHFQRHVP